MSSLLNVTVETKTGEMICLKLTQEQYDRAINDEKYLASLVNAQEPITLNEVPPPAETMEPAVTDEQQVRTYLWSHNATKFLLATYKEMKGKFADRGIKKDSLWRKIAILLSENGFGCPTAQQTEDKLKNLRRTYAKVKDAMGPGSSGAPAPSKFKYYEDLEDIFGSSPSYSPPVIAGNRRAHEALFCIPNLSLIDR